MKKAALLVTHEYFDEGSNSVYADIVWGQFNQLKAALAQKNIELTKVFWEDLGIDWAGFDLVTPLMAWNYPQNLPRFLDCLEEIANAKVPLANPQKFVRDNFDKGYLIKLYENGAPVPKTLEISADDTKSILQSFDILACDEIIIKPRIGAGAWRQARLKRGEALPARELLPPDLALIQAFIPSVAKQGELSLLFMGGEFSHALMKTPKAGDYRTQTRWGATETNINPPQNALIAAQAILQSYDAQNELAYARMDFVETENKEWLLMEMEIIEPYLYLPFDGQEGQKGAKNFANAIAKVL